jgi:hypothetical protein
MVAAKCNNKPPENVKIKRQRPHNQATTKLTLENMVFTQSRIGCVSTEMNKCVKKATLTAVQIRLTTT